MPFIFFFLPTALDTTSNALLNSRGESGQPCLISYLGRKAFSLPQWSIRLAVAFYICFLSSWGTATLILILLRIFVIRYRILPMLFKNIKWEDHMYLFFSPTDLEYIGLYSSIEAALHIWNKFHLPIGYNSIYIQLNMIC